jgi:hypothetical protein
MSWLYDTVNMDETCCTNQVKSYRLCNRKNYFKMIVYSSNIMESVSKLY